MESGGQAGVVVLCRIYPERTNRLCLDPNRRERRRGQHSQRRAWLARAVLSPVTDSTEGSAQLRAAARPRRQQAQPVVRRQIGRPVVRCSAPALSWPRVRPGMQVRPAPLPVRRAACDPVPGTPQEQTRRPACGDKARASSCEPGIPARVPDGLLPKPPALVLDVGSGFGRNAARLAFAIRILGNQFQIFGKMASLKKPFTMSTIHRKFLFNHSLILN